MFASFFLATEKKCLSHFAKLQKGYERIGQKPHSLDGSETGHEIFSERSGKKEKKRRKRERFSKRS